MKYSIFNSILINIKNNIIESEYYDEMHKKLTTAEVVSSSLLYGGIHMGYKIT